MNDNIVGSLGVKWRDLPEPEYLRTRFTDRRRHIDQKSDFIAKVLPEYRTGPSRKVVDFSCGNGVLLEVFRHYGHEVLGVDIQYFDFLRSQGIPFVEHDCRVLPYPFESGSCDLITCVGSISTYGDVAWGDIVAEFCRIASHHVAVRPNAGEPLEKNRAELDGLALAGWTLRKPSRDIWKWFRG